MTKAHPKHRMLILLSRIHGQKELMRAVDISDEKDVTIFELHDTEAQKEIEELEQQLMKIKEKIRDRAIDL